MNQSRGVVSAETVAATNEPLMSPADHHGHHGRQQFHSSSSNHHSANNYYHHPASENYNYNYHTNNNNNELLASSSSVVDYFTRSIHQQLNPSTSSLPSLLARSLVAFSGGDGGGGGGDNELQDRQQATTTTMTASDTDQLQLQQQYYNQNSEQSFSEWWTDYWSRQPFPSGYTQSSITLLACLITTIIFLIVVGNLLVVVAIFTEKSLKPTQNWFIASLAVSDMLLGLVVMPFSLARELMGFWIFGPLWCDIHEAIDVLLTTASINTLCLISLDRYWSITQAVNYLKKRTPKRGAFMIAFVWFFSAAVSLPPLFGWKKQSPTIIANITSSSSSSSNKHRKSHLQHQQQLISSTDHNQPTHQHHQQYLTDSSAKSVATTTTSPPTTTSDATNWRAKRRRALSGQQTPLDRHRRQELATPMLGGKPLADHHNQALTGGGSRLMLRTMRSPSNGQRDSPEVGGSSSASYASERSPLADFAPPQDQSSSSSSYGYNSNANTPSSEYLATGSQASPAPAAANSDQVTEYPSCQLSDDIGYVLYSALGSFYIPCAVMVFTYIKIFLAARSRARRAINKQSRGAAAAANKRLAGRRTPNTQQQQQQQQQASGGNKLETSGNSNLITSCNSMVVSTTGLTGAPGANNQLEAQGQMPPMMKGKIVIVERKKSLAAPTSSAIASFGNGAGGEQQLDGSGHHQAQSPPQPPPPDHQLNRATYTCSEIITSSSGELAHRVRAGPEPPEVVPSDSIVMNDGCTLTMSSAKQASPSALNGDGYDSSMITVMTASMTEVPVTRFNFKQQTSVRQTTGLDSCSSAASAGAETTRRPTPPMPIAGGEQADDDQNRKKAALLKALSEAITEDGDQLLKGVWSSSSSAATVPVGADSGQTGTVVDGGGGGGDKQSGSMVQDKNNDNRSRNTFGGGAADVSSSSMLLNSGSDHNNNKINNSDGLVGGGGGAGGSQVVAGAFVGLGEQADGQANTTNETCFMNIEEDSDMFEAQTGRTIMMIAGNASQKQTNLGKAQGGIMMTMLPTTTTANTQQQLQSQGNSQHQTMVCNNVVCMRPHQPATTTRSGSSYCGSSLTINDDDDDEEEEDDVDDCVDDELLTDDCNGYSVSCNLDQYCSRAASCPQCHECRQQEQQQQQQHQQQQEQEADNNNNSANRHLSISDSSNRKKHSKQQPPTSHHHHHHHHHSGRRISEAHSITGDDNLSLNEYRSNEDSSSIVGHDVLDATEVHKSSDRARPASSASQNEPTGAGIRKKSSIGFRLTRLGSTVPLSVQTSGLLALATSQQQQQQQQHHTGGTRNLKALRQNFFMKLNQLTAKSAAKQHDQKSNKRSLNNETSPTGKSSAQSSGTSFDCATTSNVQSADYEAGVTAGTGTLDDYDDQQTNGPQNDTPQGLDSRRQQHRDSSGGSSSTNSSSTSNKPKHQEGQASMRPTSNPSGKTSPADDKFKNSTGINNNQLDIDKNDDRALLLHDPQGPNGGPDSDKRLLGKSNSMLVTSGQGNKSQMKFDGDQQQLQRNNKGSQGAGQLNHSSASAPSSAPVGGGTNRAYLASDNERHKRKLAKARERRATLILGLIMTTFVCSWMPFFTFYVLRALCNVCRDFISPRFEAFIFWMGYCNSAINPIIYTIFNRDFRKAFRKILFKCL